MLEAPMPANEAQRLALVQALGQLDTDAEERFDRVVDIAKLLFDVPIVLISLLDADRQWFKSRRGLESVWTERSISFCGHAIQEDQVMVVEDALADQRFRDNPLVLGSPFIRFYAGAPLIIADGLRAGTLCLIDQAERSFSDDDRELLGRLAGIVRDELVRPPAASPQDLAQQAGDGGTRGWLQRLQQCWSAARPPLSKGD